MVEEIIGFKRNWKIKNHGLGGRSIDKSSLCRLLVTANISELVIHVNTTVPAHEKNYFEGGAFINRIPMTGVKPGLAMLTMQ